MDSKEKKVQEELQKLADSYKDEVGEATTTICNNIFKNGVPAYQAMAIPRSKLEGIYAQAYQQYNAGNYEKAFKTFEMLAYLNNDDPRFMFGMAACFQGLKKYKQAYNSFLICAMLDKDNPVPYYHAADCCLQEGEKISALVMLQIVIQKSEGKPEYSYIKDRSEVLKESLTLEINGTVKK